MLHTFPDAAEIVTAVREFLEREVMPRTAGRLSFHARVAANLLITLEREMQLGAETEARYAHLLHSLGVGDETELAEQIRTRQIAGTDPRVVTALDTITRDRLRVSNPVYLADEIDDDPRQVNCDNGQHGEEAQHARR